jgi:hypothetical protein
VVGVVGVVGLLISSSTLSTKYAPPAVTKPALIRSLTVLSDLPDVVLVDEPPLGPTMFPLDVSVPTTEVSEEVPVFCVGKKSCKAVVFAGFFCK